MEALRLGPEIQAQLDEVWQIVRTGRQTHTKADSKPVKASSTSSYSILSTPDVPTPEISLLDDLMADLTESPNRAQLVLPNKENPKTLESKERPSNGIREYFDRSIKLPCDIPWLSMPELPTSAEVGLVENGKRLEGNIEVSANKIDSPWSDRFQYLQAHYELLREDGIAPLRQAIEEIRAKPELMEKDSKEHAAIYENVYITGVTFAQRGIAFRVQFSLRRTGKMIRWEQSKRLTAGTLVALTPATDMFEKVCKVAVVAARPLIGLQQAPPVVDLFFNCTEELEIDPQEKWLMVEARSGYYEAQRHTLRALQQMSCEKFPLEEHIVKLEKHVPPPEYIQEQPLRDVSAVSPDSDKYINVNVLDEWPTMPESTLDQSQLAALRRILSKRLAIIQGPPGTGKTHVSVVAMKVLLSNMSTSDPPIIVTAQTNHALDQLLRHIAEFEPNFVRLGGRTADQLIIRPRTLYEIKRLSPPTNNGSSGGARRLRKTLAQKMVKSLEPLEDGKEPLKAELFQSYGLLTEAQVKSLVDHGQNWAGDAGDGSTGLMGSWLGGSLLTLEKGAFSNNADLEVEEVDLEFEQMKELEAESAFSDDDNFEMLRGEWVPLMEPYTARRISSITDARIEQILKERQDLYRIHQVHRGSVYCYLQRKVKGKILNCFRADAKEYTRLATGLQISKWEVDLGYLKAARIIGMTTTGLSKNRALVASLKPRVVLIEEAAETLEAHVTAACFESLQQLILVGDHQQLRGNCAVKDLEGDPYYLDVSMFERLVTNNFEFSQLTRQRRMRPEIRQIISPIYENLHDHPCVESRADVPGMGSTHSFFYTHTSPESSDDAMSKRNLGEADMVIGFFNYLVYNGMDVKDITVLTFYNGQRKRILQGLKTHPNFQGDYRFKVATVDSYQGEENEVVVLSLVRNNPREIGFLNIDNRVCVALSRARRGFYIFGNNELLQRSSLLWKKVLDVMKNDPPRIGQALPITCSNHGTRTAIKFPSEWEHVNGGCKAQCEGSLPCGHGCKLKCHPFDHAVINCNEPCARIQEGCGHPCLEVCRIKPCRCSCGKREHSFSVRAWPLPDRSVAAPSLIPKKPQIGGIDIRKGSKAWKAFAAGGHRLADAVLQKATLSAQEEAERRKLDDEAERALFGPKVVKPVANERRQEVDGAMEEASPRKRTICKSLWTPTIPAREQRKDEKEVSLLD